MSNGHGHNACDVAICYICVVARIVWNKRALKSLRSIPGNLSSVIRGKIEGYAAAPADFANVVIAMQGKDHKGELRMRVGDWRVLIRWDGEVLEIVDIAGRGDVYR